MNYSLSKASQLKARNAYFSGNNLTFNCQNFRLWTVNTLLAIFYQRQTQPHAVI